MPQSITISLTILLLLTFLPLTTYTATLVCSADQVAINKPLSVKGDMNVSGGLNLGGNLGFTGTLTSGTVPWDRLGPPTNNCSINQYVSGFNPSGGLNPICKSLQWLNNGSDIYYNTGNVGVGTPDTSGTKLKVNGTTDLAGTTYIDKDGNSALITRHIDGKVPGSGNPDNLYLQYSTGKDVNIGGGAASNLNVSGNISFTGTLQNGSVPWGRLTSLPGTCPSGQFVTGIGGSLTCAQEADPTIYSWAKASSAPVETDPTVPAWAKASSAPVSVETDPTVPAWAKASSAPVSNNEFGFSIAPLSHVGEWNNGGWWETLDRTDDLPYKGVLVSKVVLTVVAHENWDWPGIGTQYSFGEGFLSFNQEHELYNANDNTLRVTINTEDHPSIDGFNVKRVNTIRVRSEDYSRRDGGVIFHISYEGLVLKHISSGLISTGYLKYLK